MRHKPRLDQNHAQIVAVFRKLGCSVQSLAGVGGGCPDLLIARCGEMRLVEVKSPKGGFTPDQVEWQHRWNAQVDTVRTVEEAVGLVNSMV